MCCNLNSQAKIRKTIHILKNDKLMLILRRQIDI